MGTVKRANRSVLRLVKGSWEHIGTPRLTRCFTNRLTLSPGNKISEKKSEEKTTLPEASTCIAMYLYVTARYTRPGWKMFTSIPFQGMRQSLHARFTPVFSDRQTHVQLLFTRNPSQQRLQCFHVNTCYSHQDLHQELFYSKLRQELRGKPQCPTTHCCIL